MPSLSYCNLRQLIACVLCHQLVAAFFTMFQKPSIALPTSESAVNEVQGRAAGPGDTAHLEAETAYLAAAPNPTVLLPPNPMAAHFNNTDNTRGTDATCAEETVRLVTWHQQSPNLLQMQKSADVEAVVAYQPQWEQSCHKEHDAVMQEADLVQPGETQLLHIRSKKAYSQIGQP
jgi:hypothetical protein